MARTIILCLITVGVIFAGSVQNAAANGYKILNVKSAKATAMGEAFIVQADDPSAVAFNPAGLAQLRGNQANLQVTLCNGYTEHTAPDGTTTDNEDTWQAVPALFITSDFGQENLAAGLGVSLPNGLSSEWPKDSFARYVATYSSLTVADISPALGVKVNDALMVGAGANFYYSEASLKQMLDMGLANGAPGAADIQSVLDGDGTAWGFNLGVICTISERHSVAATYRSAYSIDYDGTLAAAGMASPISATVDFPASAVIGYAFRPCEKWKVEVNADWTEWSKVGDITIDFITPGMDDLAQVQGLKDTVAWKFGVEHQCTDNIAIRGGYIYNENATSDEALRPSLPDTDNHFFTAGIGYAKDSWIIDGALQLVLYETRSVDNNVDFNELTSSSSVDGSYRTWAPCLSVSATRHF